MESITPRPRPYWHVDAKWVCGLVFAAAFGISLVIFSLWRLTDEKVAVPLATLVVANMFSKNGLDDATELVEFRQKALQETGDTITVPIGAGVTIAKTDVLTLSPRKLRLKIFRQVIEPYYRLGVDGVAKQTSSVPAEQEKIKQQAGLLSLFNNQTHQALGRFLWIAGGIAAIFLAGLVFFSAGWGRLVSPAVAMLFVAGPNGLFSFIAANARPDGKGGPIPNTPPEVAQTIGQVLVSGYGWVAAIAGLLLVAALVGKLTGKIISARRRSI